MNNGKSQERTERTMRIRKTIALSSAAAAIAGGIILSVPGVSLAETCNLNNIPNYCYAGNQCNGALCYYFKFYTWRTDGSLAEQSHPAVGNVVGWIYGNGAQVDVFCQTSGGSDPYDGLPYTVWDQLTNGTYVYDYYVTTPAPDGQFTTEIPKC